MLLGVDVGGTFTDAALIAGDGRLVTAKAPSTPDDQSRGVIDAVEAALARAGAEAGDVARFVHGMTVGTNALLEGKVAKTALFATEGFTDLEELGRQARADLYRLCAGHPPPLVPAELRVPVPERCGPEGVLRELDVDALRNRLADLPGDVESAAVCLLWGFRHHDHEDAVAELLPDDMHVSASHEAAGVFREYERCATTIVDAAVSPLLRRYLERSPTARAMPAFPRRRSSCRAAAWSTPGRRRGTARGRCSRARPAARSARRPQATRRARATWWRSTWVERRAMSPWRPAAAWRQPGGARSAAARWPCRWSTCTPSVRAVVDRVARRRRCAARGAAVGRRRPRARGLRARRRRADVTDANLLLGYLDADSPLAGGVALDVDAAERAVAALGESLDMSPATRRPASCASRVPRWRAPCAS